MITVTKSSTCDAIYVDGIDIVNYILSNPKTVSLALDVDYQCSGTPTSFALNMTNLDLIERRFQLDPDDMDMTDTFTDGIYGFELVVTTIATGSTSTSSGCHFVDCTTKCLLVEDVADDYSTLAGASFLALSNVNDCADCNCADACIVYTYMNGLLTQNSTSNTNGCSEC